jgi:hypothetical protein
VAADIERARGLVLLAALLWVGSLLVLLSARALREERS